MEGGPADWKQNSGRDPCESTGRTRSRDGWLESCSKKGQSRRERETYGQKAPQSGHASHRKSNSYPEAAQDNERLLTVRALIRVHKASTQNQNLRSKKTKISMVRSDNRKSCHSDQYLAGPERASPTVSPTAIVPARPRAFSRQRHELVPGSDLANDFAKQSNDPPLNTTYGY